MGDLKLVGVQGGERLVSSVEVERFTRGLIGEVLHPADAGYDEARTVWNSGR